MSKNFKTEQMVEEFKKRIVMMKIETKHTTCGEFGSSKEVLDAWTRDGERNLSPFSITFS
uniref:Uncharacterized protein n=1 Tax=Rhizophagus irregularis (strain DAOM 181602 / DAOM 197198 / MUCL 43194) TaxID=747089 RepID=U9TB04_RHIID